MSSKGTLSLSLPEWSRFHCPTIRIGPGPYPKTSDQGVKSLAKSKYPSLFVHSRSYEEYLSCTPVYGRLQALPANARLGEDCLAKKLRLLVNYGCKKFYNIGTWRDSVCDPLCRLSKPGRFCGERQSINRSKVMAPTFDYSSLHYGKFSATLVDFSKKFCSIRPIRKDCFQVKSKFITDHYMNVTILN